MEKQHKLNYLTPDTEVVEFRLENTVLSAGNEKLGDSGYGYGDSDFV